MSRLYAVAAATLVVACSPAPDGREVDAKPDPVASPANTSPASSAQRPLPNEAELTAILREDGLLLETPGRGHPLKFGESTPEQAQDALKSLGLPRKTSNAECPAGPLDFMEWNNGLQLSFQDGHLAGWWASNKARGMATAAGLRPGSLRSAIGTATIDDTSIGKVFTVDGVNGILDEASGSRVTALWAGAACIFS